MKSIQLKFIPALLFLIVSVSVMALPTTTPSQNIAPISGHLPGEEKIDQKNQKVKKGFFAKLIQNRLAKKFEKLSKDESETDNITKRSSAGLILGILSFLLLFVGLAYAPLWIVAGVLAFAADIFSIIVLTETKKNKAEYSKQRSHAKVGLILALLTGLIPIALLIIVFLSFQ